MRHGFRLVDMMAMIAVGAFGMMLTVAFLRPRGCYRNPCQSNERCIALALAQYLDNHQTFPASAVDGRGHSGFMLVMPWLDEADLYNSYNLSVPNWSTASNGSGVSNAAIGGTSLVLLRCTANPNVGDTPASQVATLDGSGYPGTAVFAKGHYAFNWGGGRYGWGSDFERTHGAYRGVMMTVGSRNTRGEEGRLVGLRDITDGTAYTILLTEKRDSQGWNVGGWAGSEFDVGPTACYHWNDPWGQKVFAGSYHDGRLNVAFADGSVRNLSDKIDRKVWYALITRNGAEPITQDELER